MKSNDDFVIVIPGKSLYINRVYYVESSIVDRPWSEAFIIGQVRYPDEKIVMGACVEIIELGDIRKSIGCTFTNESGEYEIYFKYKPYLNYELNIYDTVFSN